MSAYNEFAVRNALAILESALDILAAFGHMSNTDNLPSKDGKKWQIVITLDGIQVDEERDFVIKDEAHA